MGAVVCEFKLLRRKHGSRWLGVLGAIALVACGESANGGSDDAVGVGNDLGGKLDDGGDGNGLGGDGDTIAQADAAPDIGPPVTVDEAFWVVYTHRKRVTAGPASPSDNDVVLTHWQNPDAIKKAVDFGRGKSPLDPKKNGILLTEIAFKLAGGLTCNYGCQYSRSLKYMAIATGAPDKQSGLFKYQLGVVNKQLEVFVGKFAAIDKVKHLTFAGDVVFYSTPVTQLKTGKSQYEIRRLDLNAAEGEKVVTKMAPDNDPDVSEENLGPDSTYDGYFYVSDDASTVLVLSPTIRSQRVYAVRGGTVSQLDYICENPQGDSCTGTGSQYHDDDGVALSQDGKVAVMFTLKERWLRVRKYVIGTDEKPFSNLVQVDAMPYKENACKQVCQEFLCAEFDGKECKKYSNVCRRYKPGSFAFVAGVPWFSADQKYVFFRSYIKCGADAKYKAMTNVHALPVAKIGSVLAPDDVIDLTHNNGVSKGPTANCTSDPPDKGVAMNRVITDFAMSPQRQVFLISATATYGSDGSPIPDCGQRHMDDRELYTMIVGSSEMVKLTNELSYDALAPRAVLPNTP